MGAEIYSPGAVVCAGCGVAVEECRCPAYADGGVLWKPGGVTMREWERMYEAEPWGSERLVAWARSLTQRHNDTKEKAG